MKTFLFSIAVLALCSGCAGFMSQAPVEVSFNWRSTQDTRLATTGGYASGENGAQTVQADKTNELDTAVTTSSGTANAIKRAEEEKPTDKTNQTPGN